VIDLEFEFAAKLWEWRAGGEVRSGSWYFVTLPKSISDDIRSFTRHKKSGFGSVRVKAKIGQTEWSTSLFPSKEKQAYILPIKKAVRTAENLAKGKSAQVYISVLI